MEYTFRLGILTISDTRSADAQHSDQSGDTIASITATLGYQLVVRETVSDDLKAMAFSLLVPSELVKVHLT